MEVRADAVVRADLDRGHERFPVYIIISTKQFQRVVTEGGVVRASCLLEGIDWEPRALLRIEFGRGQRTPSVELSFEYQGERVDRWSKVRRILEELRWG